MFDIQIYLEKPKVQVLSINGRLRFLIKWPSISGAEKYRVYAGYDPLHIRSLISQDIPNTETSFIFNIPFNDPFRVIYFWVRYYKNGQWTFIEEAGSYSYVSIQLDQFNGSSFYPDEYLYRLGDDLYRIEEMRKRAKSVLEDTGEDVDVYIKQWRGLPDPTTQEELGLDPNYQGMSRDDSTYGTGIYPGFFPPIRIKVRLGGLPNFDWKLEEGGKRPLLSNEFWTLWTPLLSNGDVLCRLSNGLRYEINDNIGFSNWRSVPITQRGSFILLNPNHPLYKLEHDDIWNKWNSINKIEYNKIGFNIIADGGGQIEDYLLFV